MIKKIEPDKWRHFYAGILMGIVLQAILLVFFYQLVVAVLISFILVLAISYGFELVSKWTGVGHYDVWDAVASIIGGVVGMLMIIVLEVFL